MKKIKKEKELKFKIGSDPEFTIIFRNEKIPANIVENTIFKKCSIKTAGGELGIDGHNSTGEIRPNPSTKISEAVNNIGLCLYELVKKMPGGFDLTTLSMHDPIGGHVHLNLPKTYKYKDKYQEILPVLCFPIFMGENNISSAMRLMRSYGVMNDIRNERERVENGINCWDMELRGLSAEWITTEKICYATLAYIATIHEALIDDPDILKQASSFSMKDKNNENILSAIYLTKNKLFAPVVIKQIEKIIKRTEGYKHFKEEIDFIIDYKKVLQEKKKAEFSIVKGWKMKHENTPKEILEKFSGFTNIGFNSDVNIDNFAKNLSCKIIEENLQKFQYMLFGVRKEVKDFIVFNEKGKILDIDKYQNFVKSNEDMKIASEIFAKMGIKFANNCSPEYAYEWNIDRTMLKKTKREQLIIGIPRNIREKNRTESLNKLIDEIEKGNYKTFVLDKKNPIKKIKKAEKKVVKNN